MGHLGRSREDLQRKLEEILNGHKAYFQPPERIKIQYPCVVYELAAMDSSFADNDRYWTTRRYQLTIIDRNPDSELFDAVASLPFCQLQRTYTADYLNHTVFQLDW